MCCSEPACAGHIQLTITLSAGWCGASAHGTAKAAAAPIVINDVCTNPKELFCPVVALFQLFQPSSTSGYPSSSSLLLQQQKID